jgi:hypothetical protein
MPRNRFQSILRHLQWQWNSYLLYLL